jgi:hypothetical protein
MKYSIASIVSMLPGIWVLTVVVEQRSRRALAVLSFAVFPEGHLLSCQRRCLEHRFAAIRLLTICKAASTSYSQKDRSFKGIDQPRSSSHPHAVAFSEAAVSGDFLKIRDPGQEASKSNVLAMSVRCIGDFPE